MVIHKLHHGLDYFHVIESKNNVVRIYAGIRKNFIKIFGILAH